MISIHSKVCQCDLCKVWGQSCSEQEELNIKAKLNAEATMDHMKHISAVALHDIRVLKEKEKSYQGSWKKRGGSGAFHMLARKWDRIEVEVKRHNYDIFLASEKDTRIEPILEDIGDLRRYLMLVEAELTSRARTRVAKLHEPTEKGKNSRLAAHYHAQGSLEENDDNESTTG